MPARTLCCAVRAVWHSVRLPAYGLNTFQKGRKALLCAVLHQHILPTFSFQSIPQDGVQSAPQGERKRTSAWHCRRPLLFLFPIYGERLHLPPQVGLFLYYHARPESSFTVSCPESDLTAGDGQKYRASSRIGISASDAPVYSYGWPSPSVGPSSLWPGFAISSMPQAS